MAVGRRGHTRADAVGGVGSGVALDAIHALVASEPKGVAADAHSQFNSLRVDDARGRLGGATRGIGYARGPDD